MQERPSPWKWQPIRTSCQIGSAQPPELPGYAPSPAPAFPRQGETGKGASQILAAGGNCLRVHVFFRASRVRPQILTAAQKPEFSFFRDLNDKSRARPLLFSTIW